MMPFWCTTALPASHRWWTKVQQQLLHLIQSDFYCTAIVMYNVKRVVKRNWSRNDERTCDDEDLIVSKSFSEETRDNKFWWDEEEDLLLNATSTNNSSTNKSIRKIHLNRRKRQWSAHHILPTPHSSAQLSHIKKERRTCTYIHLAKWQKKPRTKVHNSSYVVLRADSLCPNGAVYMH